MKKMTIRELVPTYPLTSGRRKVALERCLEVARNIPRAGDIVARIPGAVALQCTALDAALSWQNVANDVALHDPGAVALHVQLSRAISGLYDHCVGLRDYSDEPEVVALATDLITHHFAQGVKALIVRPYLEQNQDVERLVLKLEAPEYEEHRRRLGLDLLLATLARINRRFGEKLVRPERFTFEDAKAANVVAESAFVAVYCTIVATFPRDDDPDLTHRAELMNPIYDQIHQLAAHRAARRAAKAAQAGGAAVPAVDVSAEEAALAEDAALDQALAAGAAPTAEAPAAAPAAPTASEETTP